MGVAGQGAAVRVQLGAEGRRWHVFRVTDTPEGQRVERLEVTRGFEERDRVEILAADNETRALNAGDRVVVVGVSALTDGSTIQVITDEDTARAPETASDESATDEVPRVAT